MREVEYCSGFVAVFGPDAADFPLRFPSRLRLPAMQREAGDRFQVVSFGDVRPPASAPQECVQPSWIKGRPFPLTPGRPLDVPDLRERARLHRSLSDFDGKFTLLLIDPRGVAVCATDLIGAGPLYYAELDRHVVVGTHLGGVLASMDHMPARDPVGTAAQVLVWAAIDGTTPYAGVRRLRHASYLKITFGDSGATPHPPEGSVHRYADLVSLLGEPAESGNGTEWYVDRFDQLLRESLDRDNYGAGTTLLLSGGRDSRAIALSLRQYFDLSPEAITFGDAGSSDLEGGRRLAEALELPHRAVPFEHWTLETYADRIIGLNGGASGLQVSHFMAGFKDASTRARMTIMGFLGDATLGSWHTTSADPDFEDIVARMFPHLLAPDLPLSVIFASELPILIERLRALSEEASELAPYQRLMICEWLVRDAAMASTAFDLGESYLEISYPFFYRPLLHFSLHLPAVLLNRMFLYDTWIARKEQLLAIDSAPRSRAGCITCGTRPLRPEAVSWKERTERSMAWLSGQIAASDHDGELQRLCRRSLERASGWSGEQAIVRPPTALSLLPILRCGDFCR